jgi:hypothetical protein
LKKNPFVKISSVEYNTVVLYMYEFFCGTKHVPRKDFSSWKPRVYFEEITRTCTIRAVGIQDRGEGVGEDALKKEQG